MMFSVIFLDTSQVPGRGSWSKLKLEEVVMKEFLTL